MFDAQKTLQFIESQAKLRRPIHESMTKLINKCQAQRPHPDWNKLRQLDYSDLSGMEKWITYNFTFDPPDFTLQGVCFALVSNRNADQHSIDLVIGGTAEFNWNNEDNFTWSSDQYWEPGEDHLHSEVLSDIYRIAYPENSSTSPKEQLGNDAEYSICLGYAVFGIVEILQDFEPSLMLHNSDVIGIRVGFYGGDDICVGKMLSTGFRYFED